MTCARGGARDVRFRQPRPKTPPLALVDVPRRQAAPVGAAMPEPKRVREVPERRTANASFFQLADGRTQAEVSSTPVHYRDAAGRWQPIDTRLVRVDAGYGNSTNTFASRFGTTSTGLARFDLDGRTVAVGVAGPQRPLVPTAAAGDTVRYPAAFGDGADLAYRVTGTAMKGAIVLTRPPAEDSFTLTLDLNGVTARQLPDGAIGFFVPERDTQPLLVMPKPFMYDAKGDSRSPYGAAWSGAVSQTLRQENGRAMVVVRRPRLADRSGPCVPGDDRSDHQDPANCDAVPGHLDVPTELTFQELEELVDARLAHTPRPGLYRVPDLLRMYSAELAADNDARAASGMPARVAA